MPAPRATLLWATALARLKLNPNLLPGTGRTATPLQRSHAGDVRRRPVLVIGAMNVAARGTCRLAGAWTSSRRAGRSTGLPFHALQVALVACGGDPA